MTDFYIGTTEFHKPVAKGRGLIRALRVSTGARYQPDSSFVPPQQFKNDVSTLLLFDFAKDDGFGSEDPRRITDRSNHGHHGTFHNAWWLD